MEIFKVQSTAYLRRQCIYPPPEQGFAVKTLAAIVLATVNWTGAPNTPNEPGAEAAVRTYAQLVVQAPACGVRSNSWAKALYFKIEGAIPKDRSDLEATVRDGFAFAVEQLLEFRESYCSDLARDHTEILGDQVVMGKRTIWQTLDPD